MYDFIFSIEDAGSKFFGRLETADNGTTKFSKGGVQGKDFVTDGVRIFASGNLDEGKVAAMLAAGAVDLVVWPESAAPWITSSRSAIYTLVRLHFWKTCCRDGGLNALLWIRQTLSNGLRRSGQTQN